MLRTIDGEPARPLGLAAHPGQTSRCVYAAFDSGVNYFFFYGPSGRSVIDGLNGLVKEHRPEVLIGCGSGARRADGLERVRHRLSRAVGADVLDVFFAEYLNPADDRSTLFGNRGVIATLAEWRRRGLIRYVGATTHDTAIASACLADPRIDVVMLRYNMAHRRLGRTVFPEAQRARRSVIAFTATRWGTLLRGRPEWGAAPPTALDCYRYCLAEPAVELVLSAASTVAQLTANLPALKAKKIGTKERRNWERYGDLVYGSGKGRFDIQWP
ncbi:MAG: aldo/keto reductase [Acidobacteriota bacterium]|nr:aldo/keto reductase [Acidobacteriota bacterium]